MSMDKVYPEFLDYIYDYCGEYFTQNETFASKYFFALSKTNNGANKSMLNMLSNAGFVNKTPDVESLMAGGFDAFKKRVAMRIYEEHKHELKLNCCPQCGKVARTSLAKQCRFCFYKWHDKK